MPGNHVSDALTVQAEQLTGGIVLLRVRGEVDAWTAPALHAAIMTQIDRQPRQLIVHLGGATFLGTAGLGVLIGAERLRPDLRLLVTNKRILRTLQLTGLADWFNVYESVSEALHS
jgi:anti-sigma B factor antagonist